MYLPNRNVIQPQVYFNPGVSYQQPPISRISFSPGFQYQQRVNVQPGNFYPQAIQQPTNIYQSKVISPTRGDPRQQLVRPQIQQSALISPKFVSTGNSQLISGGAVLPAPYGKVPITFVQGNNINRIPQPQGQVLMSGAPLLKGSGVFLNAPATGQNLDSMVDQAISRTQKVLSTTPEKFKASPSHRKYVVQDNYEGEVVMEKREGHGTFKYKNGEIYEGQWYEDKRHGFGCLYDSEKKEIYTGDWNDDKFSGHGILHNRNAVKIKDEFDYRNFGEIENGWERYEGEFHDGKKKGLGTFYLSNGEKFNGKFRDDVIHGEGTFYTKSGKIVIGHWEKNQLIRTI